MSMPNPNEPEKFPDLSLPERTDMVPAPFQPLSKPAAGPAQVYWREGDRVLAPWEPTFLYVGRIAQIEGPQALMEFEDGDSGWVLIEHIRAVTIIKDGLKVFSRRQMSPHFFPAQVVEVRGDDVCLIFEDSRAYEWTSLAGLRVPNPSPAGQGAVPVRVGSHLAFLEHLRPGDRVWAPWNTAALFVGTVDQIREKEAHIRFDDGDQGWVLLEQLIPLEIPVGLRVMGRWKMGGHFFPGRVMEIKGESIYIVYDDGDKEWTKPAALAIPCQPFGPDARPTRVQSGVGGGGGYNWAWILVPIAFAVMRAACR